ncbi:MAG: DUF3023 domain-containing protein [Lachnospiraceae bacterium]|jgi:hypothetical protein|nr:DUF3023 domain-containing protein [Lachnospiraceae bacterium]MCH4063783.1 DUF3023 domain-containing protein [Lachnospiraceae bacterium]MCH4103494.1 DUF3023 domain-containing protein [Lachnospiraceae bacterium]MCI1309847.1 DUF3023 domain-containing protein [Lachnospiraceae bacterium]MCI1334298.1 DUF3023 domain-containing protein [Lachnospiraceae bacterium]
MNDIIVTVESWPITKFILSIVAPFGGVAVVTVMIIRFFSIRIADRISKKYEAELTKNIEEYKSELSKEVEAYKAELNKEYATITTSLGKKQYISEKRFDAEFEIFQRLSLAYAEMVRDISIMIPVGVTYYPPDHEEKLKLQENQHKEAVRSVKKAQDALFSLEAFIPKEFVDEYQKIRSECNLQLDDFEKRYDVGAMVSQDEKERFTREARNRTISINEELNALTDKVRSYLESLDVIEK